MEPGVLGTTGDAPGGTAIASTGRRYRPGEAFGAYCGAVNLPDVLSLARTLMEEADVGDWELAFDRARRRAGQTDHGHDAVWAAEATRLGATGRRLVDAQAPRLRGRWVGRCPAGHEVDRMRRPASPVSCSRCAPRFSLAHLLSWSLDGVTVSHEEISERYSLLLRLARHNGREAGP